MLDHFIKKGKKYGYFKDNHWLESASGEVIPSISPINNEIVGYMQKMTTDEVDKAIKSSKAAFSSWKSQPMNIRVQILKKASKIIFENTALITALIIKEIAKPYNEALDEVVRTADLISFYGDEGSRMIGEVLTSDLFPRYSKSKTAIVERVPLGVILSIPPFNYPFNESAPKLVGAIISGNTVVLKAPSQGGITALLLGEIFRLAGLPDGVLNIITGDSSIIGDFAVSHADVAGINFTGSTKTALHIQKTLEKENRLLPLLLMGLGGKDAAIVLEDCDIKAAALNIADGAFTYSGQRCTAIKRVLVEDSIADSFLEELKSIVLKKYILGNPNDKSINMGPVISDKQAEYIESLVNDAISKKAVIICGGQRSGRYIEATILDHVSLDSKLAWEEPFGPVLPVIRIKSVDEAIDIANKSEYGLQSSVFTKNIDTAFEVAEKLEVGVVQINGKDSRGPDNFPFNGVKNSGYGNIQGAKYLIESLTKLKTTVINKTNESGPNV
ncbi:MAG: aldehyde dehydrogenase family protein [Patescibacteria group bacterium]